MSKRNFASSSYLDGGYERPKRIHPLDQLGEYWLFSRLGWIGPIFRGAEAVNHRGGSGAHHVVYARALLLKPYPELDAIRIARWSRFGDSVVQLRNAFTSPNPITSRSSNIPRAIHSSTTDGSGLFLSWHILSAPPRQFLRDCFTIPTRSGFQSSKQIVLESVVIIFVHCSNQGCALPIRACGEG